MTGRRRHGAFRYSTVALAMVLLAWVSASTAGAREWYVDNTAGPGGDGSAGRPFDRLVLAERASAPGDVLHLAVGDGTERGQSDGLRLKPGQSLVGSGMPRLAARAAAAALELADGVSVAGVAVAAPAGVAVLGRGVENVRLDQVMVTGSGGAGLHLEDAAAVILDEVTVENTRGHGILGVRVRDLALTGCRLSMLGAGDGDDAIHLEEPAGEVRLTGGRLEKARGDLLDVTVSTGEVRLTIVGAELAGSTPPATGNDAVLLRVGGTAQAMLDVRETSFEQIAGNAVDAASESAAGGTGLLVRVARSTFGHSQGSALALSAQEQGALTFEAVDNHFDTLQATAFQLAADDGGKLEGWIAGAEIVAAGAGGIVLFADEETVVRLLVEEGAVTDSSGDALAVWASGAARVDLTLAGAWRLTNVAGAGVAVEAADRARLCLDTGRLEIAARPPLRLVNSGEGEFLVAGLAESIGEAAERTGGQFAATESCARPKVNGRAGDAR